VTKKQTVYAVHWPEINVFKVGISERKRWRTFVNRGANVLAIMDDFDDYIGASDFEAACHFAAESVCRPAFTSAREAVSYLGNHGGGYMECYRVPGDLMPSEILRFLDSQLAVLHAQA
jgi:hypothetical protein